jgi:hypothetical protein
VHLAAAGGAAAIAAAGGDDTEEGGGGGVGGGGRRSEMELVALAVGRLGLACSRLERSMAGKRARNRAIIMIAAFRGQCLTTTLF